MTFLSQTNHYNAYRLLDAVTATNSPPAGAVGIDVSAIGQPFAKIGTAELRLWSTAGSATMTVTVRLWGYDEVSARWSPIGTGAAATKGVLNNGAAIEETAANLIDHSEPLYNLHLFTRIYLEITAIGGTATAISANLNIEREVA